MKKKILSIFCSLIICGSFAQVQVTLDETKQYQTIEGFGGFGPAKPWWESAPYYDAGYLKTTIDDLGVSFFRTQIFWDGETSNDNDDPNVANAAGFNFGPSSDNGKQFPFLKDLSDKGARLIATVWTPPTWMKLHDDPDRKPADCYNCWQCTVGDPGTEMCGGRLNPDYYDEFAEYLVQYVKTLKDETGVDLYGISIQNEPFFANPFESNVVMPEEYADILKVVATRFATEGLDTRFFGPEHMAEWSWGWQAKYVDEVLGDPTVKPLLDIYAVHGYVDGVAADYGSAEGWTQLYENITLEHGKPLWMTETSDYDLEGFSLAFGMARSMYLALKFGHISAWVYWSMHDQVVINNELTPLGYAFKNFYRYVRPGAVLIDATSSDPEVLSLAFSHPDTDDASVILINNSQETKQVVIEIPFEHADLTLYRTSSTENCKDLGVLTNLEISLPPQSISTITTIAGSGVTSSARSQETGTYVFPVPASRQLTVKFSSATGPHEVRATDPLGKVVGEYKATNKPAIQINTEGWKPGLYLIHINDGPDTVSRKVLID